MFIAQLASKHAKFSFGLVGLTGLHQDELRGVLYALVSAFSKIAGPVFLTGTNELIREVPDDSPASLKFKYLGAKSVQYGDHIAFLASVDEHLDRGIFKCPETFETAPNGTFTVMCRYFELTGDRPLDSSQTVH